MTTKEELTELLERVRGAKDGDRGLDLAIWNAINTHPSEWHRSWPGETVVEHLKYERGAPGNPVYELDRFTASIDAAVALVERMLPAPNGAWNVQGNRTIFYGRVHGASGHGRPTAALAILDALLKVLIAQQEQTSLRFPQKGPHVSAHPAGLLDA